MPARKTKRTPKRRPGPARSPDGVYTTFLLRQDLHKQLKLASVEEGRPMCALVEEALKLYLE